MIQIKQSAELKSFYNEEADFNFSYAEEINKKFIANIINIKDEKIKEALIAKGFDPKNIQFLKDNFQLIRQDGDKFEHLFYKHGTDEELRIISIQINPEIDTDFKDPAKGFMQTATYKFY